MNDDKILKINALIKKNTAADVLFVKYYSNIYCFTISTLEDTFCVEVTRDEIENRTVEYLAKAIMEVERLKSNELPLAERLLGIELTCERKYKISVNYHDENQTSVYFVVNSILPKDYVCISKDLIRRFDDEQIASIIFKEYTSTIIKSLENTK